MTEFDDVVHFYAEGRYCSWGTANEFGKRFLIYISILWMWLVALLALVGVQRKTAERKGIPKCLTLLASSEEVVSLYSLLYKHCAIILSSYTTHAGRSLRTEIGRKY